MPYVMIRHKVANYARWKRVVQSAAKWRKASGETCFYALRGARNPNDITVVCEWNTSARMKKFMASPDLRKAMKGAGVIGKPVISFFKSGDVLTAR
jgi:heme-degrading monooxygenase HmoA